MTNKSCKYDAPTFFSFISLNQHVYLNMWTIKFEVPGATSQKPLSIINHNLSLSTVFKPQPGKNDSYNTYFVAHQVYNIVNHKVF